MKKVIRQTVPVYIRTGTPVMDMNSPGAEFQGLTLSVFSKFHDGQWAYVMRNGSGAPSFGYLGQEISEEEYRKWEHRILQCKQNPHSGYTDSEGIWYAGALPYSVITAAAYVEYSKKLEESYYVFADKKLDEMADKIISVSELRRDEYESRYAEAVDYLANPDDSKQYPYLNAMRYKGMTLAEGAAEVVKKYEEAKADRFTLADLRMKKNLLKGNLPIEEKRAIFKLIVDGLTILGKK